MTLLEQTQLTGPGVVALGTFDGVHLGHQALLGRVVERARASGAQSVVVTFDPPPRTVLRPDHPYRLLCSLEERIELLEKHGADRVVLVRFDLDVASRTAEEFTGELVRRLGMIDIVGGPDMALGRGRQGTPPVLEQIGARLGFTVTIVPQHSRGATAVRSVEIRRRLTEGDVAGASELLGRAPTLRGTVVTGARLGRTLGYPTANLEVSPSRLIPADGIYAGWARGEDVHRPAAISIGVRPTVGAGARTIEAYLLDFNGDLYGRILTLELVERLRDEKRFESLAALVTQIGRDVEQTRRVLDASAQ